MRILIVLAVALAIFYSVNSIPVTNDKSAEDMYKDDQADEDMQGDNDNNYFDVDDDKLALDEDKSTEKPDSNALEIPAKILSTEQHVEKSVGESVDLPCVVPEDSDGVIIWYKNNDIVYQGEVALKAKRNNQLFKNNTLRITNIDAEDGASYKCEMMVSSNNKAAVVHTLVVKTPPSDVQLHAKNNRTILSTGDELVLTCTAKGYPAPEISWHREINQINERLGITGNTLTIPNVQRKDAGRYSCFADNRIGNPSMQSIVIELTHPPMISLEKIMVNSDKNMNVELKCTVKAKPEAAVVWKRGGVNIVSSDHVRLLPPQGNDHILILNELEESDFGKYVCFAKNYLGSDEREINLVKTPAVIGFIKPEKPTRDLVLTWQVESKSEVTEHELQYRKKGDEDWQTVKPTVRPSEEGIYIIKYTLTGLGEGTYETRARSKNSHGWSDYSDITLLEGAIDKQGHHKHGKNKHKHNKEKMPPSEDVTLAQQLDKDTKVGESTDNGVAVNAGSLMMSCTLLVFTLIYRL